VSSLFSAHSSILPARRLWLGLAVDDAMAEAADRNAAALFP